MSGLSLTGAAQAPSGPSTGPGRDSATRASVFTRTPWLAVALLAVLASGCTAPQPSPLPPPDPDAAGPVAGSRHEPACARCPALQADIEELRRQLVHAESELSDLRAERLEQAKALERSTRQATHATARLKRLATPAAAASYIAEVEASIAVANTDSKLPGNPTQLAIARETLDASMKLYAQGDYEAAIDRADRAAQMVAKASETPRGSRKWKRSAGRGWRPQALQVRVDSHMRRGPSRRADARGVLRAGTPVVGFERRGVWVRVATADGDSGWVYRPLLGPR